MKTINLKEEVRSLIDRLPDNFCIKYLELGNTRMNWEKFLPKLTESGMVILAEQLIF
jgi:hypothetical protein